MADHQEPDNTDAKSEVSATRRTRRRDKGAASREGSEDSRASRQSRRSERRSKLADAPSAGDDAGKGKTTRFADESGGKGKPKESDNEIESDRGSDAGSQAVPGRQADKEAASEQGGGSGEESGPSEGEDGDAEGGGAGAAKPKPGKHLGDDDSDDVILQVHLHCTDELKAHINLRHPVSAASCVLNASAFVYGLHVHTRTHTHKHTHTHNDAQVIRLSMLNASDGSLIKISRARARALSLCCTGDQALDSQRVRWLTDDEAASGPKRGAATRKLYSHQASHSEKSCNSGFI